MTRRNNTPFNERRYIGNASVNKMEVHDLDNEDAMSNGCQIDEIKEIVTFDPDTLEEARSKGFNPCDKCFEGSTR